MEIDRASPALLRHRLFPRAMAWDVHQAAQHGGVRYRDDLAYPAEYAEDDRLPYKAAKLHRNGSPLSSFAPPPPPPMSSAAYAPDVGDRELLFRTIGKWLDHRQPEAPHDERGYPARTHQRYYDDHHPPYADYDHAPRSSPLAYAPRYDPYDAALPRGMPHGGSPIYDMVKLHHHGRTSPSPSTYTASSSHSLASPTHSHSSTEGTNTKKRQRGPSGSTLPPSATTSSGVARPGMSTSSAKRCTVQDCGKIAVSKGLCRGHGGGRRCTFAGCTKCAQSRSPFCWAHGGGKRCEAPNCRRSRKTKRFCVDHVDMENTVPLGTSTDSDSDLRSQTPSGVDTSSFASTVATSHSVAALHLPSLMDALKRAVPDAVARGWHTVTLPQSRDRLWPVQQAAYP